MVDREKSIDLLLYSCRKTIEVLSMCHHDIIEYIDCFQGCVDKGIVPSEMKGVIRSLYYYDNRTQELSETIGCYISKNEIAREDIEYIGQLLFRLESVEESSENLRNVLNDFIRDIDYWSVQKGLDSRVSQRIESSTKHLVNDDLVPLLYSLTSSITYLHRYSELVKEASMECVYASPELMSEEYFKDIERSQESTYPLLHAVEDMPVRKDEDIEEDLMMREIYGGPVISSRSAITSGSQTIMHDISDIHDPDEIIQTCRKCGQSFAMRLKECPYCGTNSRRESLDYAIKDDPSMACVYASPERTSLKNRIADLFLSLILRQ